MGPTCSRRNLGTSWGLCPALLPRGHKAYAGCMYTGRESFRSSLSAGLALFQKERRLTPVIAGGRLLSKRNVTNSGSGAAFPWRTGSVEYGEARAHPPGESSCVPGGTPQALAVSRGSGSAANALQGFRVCLDQGPRWNV